jgi:hypothetical protein
MFKLNPWNIVFWAIAPTYLLRFSSQHDINKKLEIMWNVHLSRKRQGLGKTEGNLGAQNHRQGENV